MVFLALVSASCRSAIDVIPWPKVAFFQNLSVDDHSELVSPSYFGLSIRLAEAGAELSVQVDQFDIGSDPSGGSNTARKIISDRSYVAVVIAPFVQESPQVAQLFAGAGLMVVSLSPDSQNGGTGAAWRQLVPAQKSQATELAGALAARGMGGICLGQAADPYSTSLAALTRAAIPGPPAASFQLDDANVAAAVLAIKNSRCSVVGWVGFPAAAAALRDGMSAAGMHSLTLVGADSMKTISYIQLPGRDGTYVTCPCADVTTASELAAKQLVHDYQASTGLEPGIYAAEAWDAGGMLLRVLQVGITRAGVVAGFDAMSSYTGVARDYSFVPDGALAGDPAAGLFVSAGVRWLPA